MVGPPTDAEMETAITGNVANLMTVVGPLVCPAHSQVLTQFLQMKAVNKFKKLVANNRPPIMSSILGDGDSSRFFQPPFAMQQKTKPRNLPHKSRSLTLFDRQAIEGELAVKGVHRDTDMLQDPHRGIRDDDADQELHSTIIAHKARQGGRSNAVGSSPPQSVDQNPDQGLQPQLSRISTGVDDEEQYLTFRPEHPPPARKRTRSYDEAGRRGHAHDPLQDHLYLHIGPSTFSGTSENAGRRANVAPDSEEEEVLIVSESPGAADIDIYETAYRDEIERIRQRSREEGVDEEEPTVYLTRRVDARLLAVSQLAGRFMAKGEEGLDKFDAATGWRDKKARVTDVSRALRAAARDEYEKRRQERRQKARMAATRDEAAKPLAESIAATVDELQPQPHDGSGTESAVTGAGRSRTPSMFAQAAFAGRAKEKGRQAKTSFKSLIGMRKDKGNDSKDDETPFKRQTTSKISN